MRGRNKKREFCELFVHLDGQPIRFDGRPYLDAVYGSRGRNLVIRASRQVEKSTLLANTILYEAAVYPGTQILFVCPRMDQARVFSRSRLLPALEASPLLRRTLLRGAAQRTRVTDMRFANGSHVFLRAAYRTADAARGISADLLLVDEFQDMAAGDLPVLEETLSHARNGRTILTGTPKLMDNHLETVFMLSTANEWTVACGGCGGSTILDERCLGSTGIICPACGHPLDSATGSWRARNPAASWGDGFWINHLMVPWLNFDEILQRYRVYALPQFKNEVLGLPTSIGEHAVTRAELEACCRERPMAASAADVPGALRGQLVAGVDWGGGGTARTVVVLGAMRSDFVFEVYRFARFRPDEDPSRVLAAVAAECRNFAVRWVAADGGGQGHVYNRLLMDQLGGGARLYAILYSAADHKPWQDGALWKWTVHRSASIGILFSRIKKQTALFPRVADAGSYLDEFAAVVAEYNDINRTLRYTHAPTQPDDAMHAANYALLLATRIHNCTQQAYG